MFDRPDSLISYVMRGAEIRTRSMTTGFLVTEPVSTAMEMFPSWTAFGEEKPGGFPMRKLPIDPSPAFSRIRTEETATFVPVASEPYFSMAAATIRSRLE